MTKSTRVAIRTDGTYGILRDAMLEDKQFASFFWSYTVLGEYVLVDAYGKYLANMDMWSTPGAFAHNYTELALRTMEAHVAIYGNRPYLAAMGKAFEDHWYETVWTNWAQLLRAFSTGEAVDF